MALIDLETAYRDHRHRVYCVCFRMLRNEEEAEDVTQEIFLELIKKIEQFRGDSKFTTWLHRVTVNQVLMYMRRNRKRRLAELSIEDAEGKSLVANMPGPSSVLVIEKIAIEEAFAGLSDGYKHYLWAIDMMGFEHDEAAEMVGSHVGTSKSQLHKARKKMQKLLKRKANPRVLQMAAA